MVTISARRAKKFGIDTGGKSSIQISESELRDFEAGTGHKHTSDIEELAKTSTGIPIPETVTTKTGEIISAPPKQQETIFLQTPEERARLPSHVAL